MSQQNNEENNTIIEAKEDKPKKVKTVLKIIIFLSLFTILAVGITVGAIIYKNKNNTQLSNKTGDIPDVVANLEDVSGVESLISKYKQNDLKIVEISEGLGTREPKDEWDTNTNKIVLKYVQIEGLKDYSIEEKINKQIKEKICGLYKNEELNNTKIDSVYIDASYCTANFGNILSILINKSISYKEGSSNGYGYESECLNYNLITGSKVTFKEVFTNDTSIKNILTQNIYDSLIDAASVKNTENDNKDMSKIDLSLIENETYNILNKCINNIENLKFVISPRYINIFVDDKYIEIDMVPIYKNIAIYNRFMTKESIYDGSYTGLSDIFVFANKYRTNEEGLKYIVEEDTYSNLRIEVYAYCNKESYEQEEGKKLYDEYVEKIKKDIEEVKKEAKTNPDKAIVYTNEFIVSESQPIYISESKMENMVQCNQHNKIYRMSKQYYIDTFYEKIAEYKREENGGAIENDVFNYYQEDKNVDVQTILEKNQFYNLDTGKTREEVVVETVMERYISRLKEIQNSEEELKKESLENELYWIENGVNRTKDEYKLRDESIKSIIELISDIKQKVKKITEEKVNNTTNDNIIINTILQNNSVNNVVQ